MGSRYNGTDDEVRALNAWIALVRATDSVEARLARTVPAGLTLTQIGALEALFHLGPMAQGMLAAKLLKSSGNVTLVVDNLEKRALVRRERGTTDRRCVTIHLTDAGCRLIAEVFPAHVAAIVSAMSVLEAGEQEALRALCRTLGTRKRSASDDTETTG